MHPVNRAGPEDAHHAAGFVPRHGTGFPELTDVDGDPCGLHCARHSLQSYIHPITILSSLPSAGVGALIMLMLFRHDLSVIALIGIILLIGIVKKNASMMIDFAL